MTDFSLYTLEQIIAQKLADKNGAPSYSRQILEAGVEKCCKKFGEEAFELAFASAQQNLEQIRYESADVLYHFMILLKANGISLQEVLAELEKRTAQSGLQEKASRVQHD